MNKLHDHLSDNYAWYSSWHRSPHRSHFHWGIFILVALVLSMDVYNYGMGTRFYNVASATSFGIKERANKSERVIVGRVKGIISSYDTNEFGDKLIISHLNIEVEENLKGTPANTETVDIEGGTVDGVTLHVSDLPAMKVGYRAVLFLKYSEQGKLVPAERGRSILKLNKNNVNSHDSTVGVRSLGELPTPTEGASDTGLSLEQIRTEILY